MKQFILKEHPGRDGIVRLEGSDYRYLVRVRRLAVGEYFPALLPGGGETLIKILSTGGNILTGQVCGIQSGGAEDGGISALNRLSTQAGSQNSAGNLPPIYLLQALPKGDKMDLIVRQAAESGIAQIFPFISEFSIKRTADVNETKLSRWEKIIREARQQSGSKTDTVIHKPMLMGDLMKYWQKLSSEGAVGILFHHEGLEQKCLHSYLNNNSNLIALAVGPEGGFSDSEVSLFKENGFEPLTIGNTILRTETAALFFTAAVKVILLERDLWELRKTKSGSV